MVIFAADSMMLAAMPPPVRSKPSARSRAAVTGEYGPPGSDVARSRPRSRNKKASHNSVYGHTARRPASRSADAGLFAQMITLPRDAWLPAASPGTDTGPLNMLASFCDTEVHTGPLPHDAWWTSRLSRSRATRRVVAQPTVVAMGSSGFRGGRVLRMAAALSIIVINDER